MTNMALEPSYRIMLDQKNFLSALSTIKTLFRKKVVKRLKYITKILLQPSAAVKLHRILAVRAAPYNCYDVANNLQVEYCDRSPWVYY